jgi:hypothetical protein
MLGMGNMNIQHQQFNQQQQHQMMSPNQPIPQQQHMHQQSINAQQHQANLMRMPNMMPPPSAHHQMQSTGHPSQLINSQSQQQQHNMMMMQQQSPSGQQPQHMIPQQPQLGQPTSQANVIVHRQLSHQHGTHQQPPQSSTSQQQPLHSALPQHQHQLQQPPPPPATPTTLTHQQAFMQHAHHNHHPHHHHHHHPHHHHHHHQQQVSLPLPTLTGHQHGQLNLNNLPVHIQPEYRIFEMNRRLSLRSEQNESISSSDSSFWWESFCNEFFDDDAKLSILNVIDDMGPKNFTIGRLLIPRFFRSLYEGGVTDLYFHLTRGQITTANLMPRDNTSIQHPPSSVQQPQTFLIYESDSFTMITKHGKPMFAKICTEGWLTLEFNLTPYLNEPHHQASFNLNDQSAMPPPPPPPSISSMPIRIRYWVFRIRRHQELIPRSAIAIQHDPVLIEQLSKNITKTGITNNTLNYLKLCSIVEPMQEIMTKNKQTGMPPRECLKAVLMPKGNSINNRNNPHFAMQYSGGLQQPGTPTTPTTPSTPLMHHQMNPMQQTQMARAQLIGDEKLNQQTATTNTAANGKKNYELLKILIYEFILIFIINY